MLSFSCQNKGAKTMRYQGIVEITNDEYHLSEGYSKSALMTFKQSPVKFYNEYILGNREQKQSDDMLLGTLVHALTLEPELLESKYHVYEHISRSTKDGKAQAKELEEFEKSGLTLIKQDIFNEAKAISDCVLSNSIAKNIIDSSFIEQSIYWVDELTGVTFKSRPDLIAGKICGDLKTCRDVSNYGFSRACVDHGYYLQAGMAKLALQSQDCDFERFVFICVSKTEPYEVINYVLDEQAIEYGINQFKYLSVKLAEELEKNDWLRPRVETLSVPKWVEWN
jgi:exodeoxyribonuclease VIII